MLKIVPYNNLYYEVLDKNISYQELHINSLLYGRMLKNIVIPLPTNSQIYYYVSLLGEFKDKQLDKLKILNILFMD